MAKTLPWARGKIGRLGARSWIPERGLLHAAVVAALLLIYLGLLLGSLAATSVTVDEFGHLPLAYGFLQTRDSRWLLMNPPLQTVLAALPLLGRDDAVLNAPAPKTDRDFWAVGAAFADQNRALYPYLYRWPRRVVAGLACLTGLLVYAFARGLAGPRAGLLALALFALSPDFLAHGGLVTTDLSAALAGFGVVTSIYYYTRRRTWPRLLGASLCVSLLFLSKFNALLFLPLIPLYLFARGRDGGPDEKLPRRAVRLRRVLLELSIMGAISWLILVVAYGGQGLFRPLAEFELSSDFFRGVAARLPGLPVPLPAAWFHALDLQAFDAGRPWPMYLLGRVRLDRAPWYYLAALLFKSPLALLVMLTMGLYLTRRENFFWSLVPALWLIGLTLVLPGKLYGVRLLLPAMGFFLVFVAGAFANPRREPAGRGWRKVLLVLLLVWYGFDTLLAYPNYLAYFNELARGPRWPHRGYQYLADSNLDWGQDWIRLQKWQETNNVTELRVAPFGLLDPGIYGVRAQPANCSFAPGYIAVSANLVLGVDPFHADSACYQSLQKFSPAAYAGAAVWIYRFP